MPMRLFERQLIKTVRGRNTLLNIFELWIGMSGIISGSIFFYSKGHIDSAALNSTIGHDLADVWNIMYFLAGIGIWYGLLRPSPRIEVTALWILGAATSISGVSIISFFGLHGTATAATLLSLAAASWLRADFVLRTALRLAKEVNGGPG